MLLEAVSWIAVATILAAAAGLVLSRDWRWSLGMLAAQYLAAFWLAVLQLPVGLASAKLVAGWMGIAVLGITRLGLPSEQGLHEEFWPRRRGFYLLLVTIVAVLTAAVSPSVTLSLPGLGLPAVAGSVLLIAMGLLHLGLTTDLFRAVLGLLTVLCGFEIIYAAVEGSILVAGLLALVNLGLAFIGSYLMVVTTEAAAP
jgi:hypothetical protein